jgi:hypothetical protein
MQKAGADTTAMATVMAAFCLLSIVCVVALGETSKRELVEAAPVRAS